MDEIARGIGMDLDVILNTDCLGPEGMPSLPDGSVDSIITDPPYNIGSPQRVQFDNHSKGKNVRLIGGDFGTFDNGSITPGQWGKECYRILKESGVLCSFYDVRNMDRILIELREIGFEVVQDFHWIKTNAPVPMRSVGFQWATESGYVFRKSGYKHRHNNDAGISPNWFMSGVCAGNERLDHPTQKREDLMEWLVKHWSFPNDVICDPFSGMGTTALAAWRTQRHFICMEKDEQYWKDSVKRLKPYMEQRRLPLDDVDGWF